MSYYEWHILYFYSVPNEVSQKHMQKKNRRDLFQSPSKHCLIVYQYSVRLVTKTTIS
jgi:hypothetical protein